MQISRTARDDSEGDENSWPGNKSKQYYDVR